MERTHDTGQEDVNTQLATEQAAGETAPQPETAADDSASIVRLGRVSAFGPSLDGGFGIND